MTMAALISTGGNVLFGGGQGPTLGQPAPVKPGGYSGGSLDNLFNLPDQNQNFLNLMQKYGINRMGAPLSDRPMAEDEQPIKPDSPVPLPDPGKGLMDLIKGDSNNLFKAMGGFPVIPNLAGIGGPYGALSILGGGSDPVEESLKESSLDDIDDGPEKKPGPFANFLGGLDKGLQSPSQMLGLGLLGRYLHPDAPMLGLLAMGLLNRDK